jgi:hypothetical protein
VLLAPTALLLQAIHRLCPSALGGFLGFLGRHVVAVRVLEGHIVVTLPLWRPGRRRMFGGQGEHVVTLGSTLLPLSLRIVGQAVLLDPGHVTVLLKSVARLRRGRLSRSGKGVNPLADLLQVLRDWRRVSDAEPGASLSELGLKLSDGVLVMGAFFWCVWHSKLLSGV